MTVPAKKAGRPPKYGTEADFRSACETYLDFCEERHFMPNKAGLCGSLHISRDTYNEYRSRFSDAHKEVEAYIEDAWVQRLAGTTPTGAIFYLKNAFSEHFRDQQDITSGGQPISTLTESDRKSITELRDLLKQPRA